MKKLILAGGCFWGVEAYFSRLKGVIETTVGYTDGPACDPTYQDVCASSGHVESVLVVYEETKLSLVKLLDHFFRFVDPTQKNRQGHDVGIQYRTAIFYFDDVDLIPILNYLDRLQQKYKEPIATYVKQAEPFYHAETYHQRYLDKNPNGYCHVNLGLIRPDEKK